MLGVGRIQSCRQDGEDSPEDYNNNDLKDGPQQPSQTGLVEGYGDGGVAQQGNDQDDN